MGEQTGTRIDPEFYGLGDFNVNPSPPNQMKLQNHLSSSNYLFADGHVKALKPTATGTPTNLWNVNQTTNPTDTQPGPAPAGLLNALAAQEKAMQ